MLGAYLVAPNRASRALPARDSVHASAEFETLCPLTDWLLIGRQVRTSYDKLIDLLAMDARGSIIIVELNRLPKSYLRCREVVKNWLKMLIYSL